MNFKDVKRLGSDIYLKLCKFSLQFGWFGIEIYVQSEPKLSPYQKQPAVCYP